MVEYKSKPEVILYGVEKTSKQEIPELTVQYSTDNKKFSGKITSSEDAANFIRSILPENTIELQEQFIVLYLNRSNKIKGYYRHAIGGITGVVADIRIILSAALKSLSVGMVIAHNHPSGGLIPSEADKALTKKIKASSAIMEITVLDHIIITREGYYSFADEGLLGMNVGEGKKSKTTKGGQMKRGEKVAKKVRHLSEEIKFIKRFVGLHNRKKTPNSILAFIKSLQRTISERRITKESPFVTEIRYIQNDLIQNYNKMKGEKVIKIDEKILPKLVGIAGGEEVYPSVGFIKRFISMQGKELDIKKRDHYVAQIEKAARDKKILKDDPFADKLQTIYSYLKQYKGGKKVSIEKSELNGLKCICKSCDKELGRIYDPKGKTLRRCKSGKYSDAERGACSYNRGVETLGKIYDSMGKRLRPCRSGKYSDAERGACSYNRGIETLGKIYDSKGKKLRACKSGKYSDAGKGACAYNKGLAGVMTAEQVANLKFELLPFHGTWLSLIGKPEKNFTMMIHGEPGAGKSTFLIKFAKYLTEFGKVLYFSSEEYGSVTLTNLVNKYLNPFPPNLVFAQDINAVDVSDYDFVIYDSVTDIGLKLEDYKALKAENPNTAFTIVLQHTKDGQFKGGKEWEHEAQIAAEINDGTITIYKNRYGVKGSWNFFDN